MTNKIKLFQAVLSYGYRVLLCVRYFVKFNLDFKHFSD